MTCLSRRFATCILLLATTGIVAGCGGSDDESSSSSESSATSEDTSTSTDGANSYVMRTNALTLGLAVATCGLSTKSYDGCPENDAVVAARESAEESADEVEVTAAGTEFDVRLASGETVFSIAAASKTATMTCEGDNDECVDGAFGQDGGAGAALASAVQSGP